jgi:hypothetical protein
VKRSRMSLPIEEETASPARRRVYRLLVVVLFSRRCWILLMVPWMIGGALQLHRGDHREVPYPLFNASVWPVLGGLAAAMVLFLIGWIIAAARTARTPEEAADAAGDGAVLALHLLFFWCFAAMGFGPLNGLLDFSKPRDVPVYVQDTWTTSHRSARSGGARYSTTVAFVNRIDHPNERIKIDWGGGCKRHRGTVPSPYVTLRVARGAFGLPWMGEPVCHPLRIEELPLVPGLFLGRGQPAVLVSADGISQSEEARGLEQQVTEGLSAVAEASDELALAHALFRVRSDAGQVLPVAERDQLFQILEPLVVAKRVSRPVVNRAIEFYRHTVDVQKPAYTLPLWLKAIESAASGMPIVAFYKSMPSPRPELGCPGCRVVGESDLDGRVADLFFKNGMKPATVYLSDGAGNEVFSSPLSDLARRDELAARLAARRPH